MDFSFSPLHGKRDRMKTPSLLILAVALSLTTSFADETPGALAALRALPPHFAREVVRVSADNGRPNPKRWYVLARNRSEAGLLVRNPLYSITIANGQIAEAKRFIDARQIFNRRNFINLASVRIDSSVAFPIARNALGSAGQGMRSASYQLTQTGRAADPIWDVWGYGSSNRYLGLVKLSARTGAVISTKKAIFPRL
jgi:hypothetical protein